MAPLTSYDWANFQVFEDPCTLDQAIFSPGQLKDSVLGFCRWVDRLRTQLQQRHPGLGGIPDEVAGDVLHLLNHFFPSANGVDGAPSFVDISYGQPSLSDPVCVAKPIIVSFQNHSIEITDGPTALGYIFSVARIPSRVRPGKLSWSNYVVPLLAIYSRCLYLAYIFNADWQPRVLNVPWMTCAMYFNDDEDRLAVLLGSTYVSFSVDSNRLAALNATKRSVMTLWRASHALAPGLSCYVPVRTLQPPQQPPIMVDSVVDGLYAILRGQPLASPGGVLVDPPKYKRPKCDDWRTVIADQGAAEARFDNIAMQHSTAWKSIQPPPPIDIMPLPADQIYAHPKIRKSIRDALTEIMKIRWSPGYDPDAPAPTPIDAAIINAIEVCFLPHMFPSLPPIPPATQPTPNASLPEIPPITIPGHALRATAAVMAIYTPDCRTRILDMLERFYHWVRAGDDGLGFGPPHKAKFGTCCETYPIAALMPAYFPSRVLPVAKDNPQQQDPNRAVTQVHGLAFQPRYFNNSMSGMLAGKGPPPNPGGFDSKTLNAMHDASGFNLYRKPCRNCAVLLPKLDVTVDEKYHEHLHELYGSDVSTRVRVDVT